MLNFRKLKAAKVQANVSTGKIADALKINSATVYRKFSGKSEFTLSEIATLRELLCLTDDEFEAIFFNQKLTETQAFEEE